MSWQTVFQAFSASFGAIGAWFIYDLIREFKMFKTETKTDIQTLKTERADFKNTVRLAELSIHSRVVDLQKISNSHYLQVEKSLNTVNMELERFRNLMTTATGKAETFEAFLNKVLNVSKLLNDRIRKTEHELHSLKIELGDLLIIKGEKK